MDLGYFLRSRFSLGAWLLVPPALVVAVNCAVYFYSSAAKQDCQERTAAMKVHPVIREQVDRGQRLVQRFFTVRAEDGSRIEELRARLNSFAGSHEFNLKKLSITDPLAVTRGKDRAGGVVVIIAGRGNACAFMGFLNELQQPEYLLRIDKVAVRLSDYSFDPVYDVELQLRFKEI